MKTWEMEEKRDRNLQTLITKYGHESEPVLYYSKWAWKYLQNQDIYFKTAMTWIFNED